MLITVKGRAAVIIEDDVVLRVLSLYPEEELARRAVFREGLGTGRLEFRKFKDECDVVQLPWQIFILSISALERELKNIEANRLAKAPKTLLAKRQGNGRATSRRILDRLIRSQGYLSGDASLGGNAFCGSLKRLSVSDAAERIVGHFHIDMSVFRGKRKNAALEYLIEKFEAGQINVSQGVLTNKILPQFGDARSVYKNTSGFTMRDLCVPFVFIPSEVNPDERDGRQIYTLVYLIALVGLDAYDYVMDKDFASRALKSGKEAHVHQIVSELLLPEAHTKGFTGSKITPEVRDELANSYKMTPTAVVVTLRKRGLVSKDEYASLLPVPVPTRPSQGPRQPGIKTSVRKFAGKYVFDAINDGLKTGKLFPIQAQYLIFGAVNKKKFKEYRKSLGL